MDNFSLAGLASFVKDGWTVSVQRRVKICGGGVWICVEFERQEVRILDRRVREWVSN